MNVVTPFANATPAWKTRKTSTDAADAAAVRYPHAEDVYVEMTEAFALTGIPVSRAVLVTPEFAKRLLDKGVNENNRKISDAFVRRFANDMRNARWALNGEAIVVSACGKLNTGQHRLQACEVSGVPFVTFLTVGVERGARLTDGQGKPKRAPDYIQMSGVKQADSTKLSHIATGVIGLERGVINTNPHVQNICVRGTEPTSVEVSQYVDKRRDVLMHMLNIVKNKGCVISPTRLAMVLTWLYDNGAREEHLRLFAESLVNGASLGEFNPIYQTRRYFEEVRTSRKNPGDTIEVLLRCWNQWVSGQSVTRRPVIKGVMPEVVLP